MRGEFWPASEPCPHCAKLERQAEIAREGRLDDWVLWEAELKEAEK